MKKKSVTKATAKKAVKTPAKGFTAEAVRARATEKVVAIPARKGKPVVAIDSAAPAVVELPKPVDAEKPAEPIKAVAAPVPVAVKAPKAPAEKKVPADRAAAAKRAWITIRANRAAAAAAKAS
jgi:hypothetical protein